MTSRIQKWDNIKLLLIICVVFGHMSNAYPAVSGSYSRTQFWIYLFHMPAFLFISGLFSKNTVAGKKWGKAVPYLFLFIFMKFVDFCVSVSLVGIENSSIDFFHENGVPWYALAMFWYYVVAILIQDIHPAYVFTVSVLLAVISGYSEDIGSFLVIQRSLVFFPFFYAGYLADIEKLQEFLGRTYVRAAGAAVLSASFLGVWKYYDHIAGWKRLFQGRYAYCKIGMADYGIVAGLWRVAAYVISFLMILALFTAVPQRRFFPAWLCTNTLSVFVFHKALLSLAINKSAKLAAWLATHYLRNAFILAIVAVAVTSLPIFHIPLKKLMQVPSYKQGEKP